MVEFVRFDTEMPRNKRGKTLTERFSRKRLEALQQECFSNGYSREHATMRWVYKEDRKVFRNHRPPEGIWGVYAFVNKPECIASMYIPRDVWDLIVLQCNSIPLLAQRDSCYWSDAEQLVCTENHRIPCAYHYTCSDVREVYVHRYDPAVSRSMYYKWIRYSPLEFEALGDYKGIYETFLVLK